MNRFTRYKMKRNAKTFVKQCLNITKKIKDKRTSNKNHVCMKILYAADKFFRLSDPTS